MIVNIIGAIANLTSLILWLPQARTTWRNKNNPRALKGISIGTQMIVAVNTILWCVYGILIKNVWLPLGTIIILPLACWTIYLKKKEVRKKHESRDADEDITWFKFEYFRKLNDLEKVACLKAMYNTDFKNQVCSEIMNWESVEAMNDLDKMYWDKGLFDKRINEENIL